MNQTKIETIQGAKLVYLKLITLGYRRLLRPFSRLSRKLFEVKRVKRVYGATMVLAILLSVGLPSFISTLNSGFIKDVRAQDTRTLFMLTEKSVRIPLVEYTVTQKYGFFHPGIDMATNTGSPIYPVMDGTVIKVERTRTGYGNHVVIDHGGGLQTLYAHMSTIGVTEQETVTRNSPIGAIGSTGYSTGPHLHLQVWQNGGWINPEKFLEDYLDRQIENPNSSENSKLANTNYLLPTF